MSSVSTPGYRPGSPEMMSESPLLMISGYDDYPDLMMTPGYDDYPDLMMTPRYDDYPDPDLPTCSLCLSLNTSDYCHHTGQFQLITVKTLRSLKNYFLDFNQRPVIMIDSVESFRQNWIFT